MGTPLQNEDVPLLRPDERRKGTLWLQRLCGRLRLRDLQHAAKATFIVVRFCWSYFGALQHRILSQCLRILTRTTPLRVIELLLLMHQCFRVCSDAVL